MWNSALLKKSKNHYEKTLSYFSGTQEMKIHFFSLEDELTVAFSDKVESWDWLCL